MSQETPEPTTSNKNQGTSQKPNKLSWDQTVAKFIARGISPEFVGRLTKKQVYLAIREMNEERQEDYKIAGWTVEGDKDEEMTLQHILGFGM